MYMRTYVCICIYMCIYLYTFIFTYQYMYMCIFIHVHCYRNVYYGYMYLCIIHACVFVPQLQFHCFGSPCTLQTHPPLDFLPHVFIDTHIYIYTHTHSHIYTHTYTYVCTSGCTLSSSLSLYGVATISRMLKNIGLFCKRALQKRPVFCKETYIFKHPTNRSHPIVNCCSTSVVVVVGIVVRHSLICPSCVRVHLCVCMCVSVCVFEGCCSVRQCAAVCCSVLQCVAVRCSVLHCM